MSHLARTLSKFFVNSVFRTPLQPINFSTLHSSTSVRIFHIAPLSNHKASEQNGTRVHCTLIPGDGIGPELVNSVEQVFKAINVPVDFESFFISELDPSKSVPLEIVIESIKKNRVCLKGSLAYPALSRKELHESLNMKLRKNLDLYANVVHVKSLPGMKIRRDGIDCVIVREQTEGEYSFLEHESVKGMAECLKIVTRTQSRKIAKFAFDYAVKHNRKKVTAVHNAASLQLGDGLFLSCCKEMAKLYPTITFEEKLLHNCTMQLVLKPQQFEVLVMPNLYGNVMDNIAAGLVGGAGVVAGASYSARCVTFEPGARHTFAEAAGKDVANPTGLLLASALLLSHVHLPSYGEMISAAVQKVMADGKVRTKDLGGQAKTSDFTQAVINNLKKPQ